MSCTECAQLPQVLEQLVGWRHFHGAPCWYLLREVYGQHLGLSLPVGNVLEPKDAWRRLIDEQLGNWVAVECPSRYDAVLCRPPDEYAHVSDHIGIAIAAHAFVHFARPAAGVCLGPLARYRDAGWSVRAYRYGGSLQVATG